MTKPLVAEDGAFPLYPAGRTCKRCGKNLAALNPAKDVCFRYPLCVEVKKQDDCLEQVSKLLVQSQPLRKVVADYYNIKPSALSLKWRTGKEERAQAVFSYFLSSELKFSYEKIGLCIDRGYTGVAVSIRRVKNNLLLECPTYKKEVNEIGEIYRNLPPTPPP
jgi:hypothetical protein